MHRTIRKGLRNYNRLTLLKVWKTTVIPPYLDNMKVPEIFEQRSKNGSCFIMFQLVVVCDIAQRGKRTAHKSS